MQKNGGLTVFLLALIPNPFFDLAGDNCRHAQDVGAQIPVLVLGRRDIKDDTICLSRIERLNRFQ